jgi:hypothetical protein
MVPGPPTKSTFLSTKPDWGQIDRNHLNFYRAALAARREHVQPPQPPIERGGRSCLLGERALRASRGFRAIDRIEFLTELSAAGASFWPFGDTHGKFGPCSVCWTVEL